MRGKKIGIFRHHNGKRFIICNLHLLRSISNIRDLQCRSLFSLNLKVSVEICNSTGSCPFYFHIHSDQRFSFCIFHCTFYLNSRILLCYIQFIGRQDNLLINHCISNVGSFKYLIKNIQDLT